jgi:DNA invertase Pin-like site-specific DNA recombinase
MDANDVRRLIRAEIKSIGVTAFAQKAGITRSQVYAVLNGQREPRGAVLEVFGLEKFTGFRHQTTAQKPSNLEVDQSYLTE